MSTVPRVSVIIPVYNVEAYFRQCLDSVVNQTLRDIEVVCVDDGSTDGSTAILAEYAAKDPRIRVLRQENRGTHVARKAGVSAATGDWCLFLDPDDWLVDDALRQLSLVLGRTDADIVGFGFIVHARDDRVKAVAQSLDRQFNPSPRTCGRDDLFTAVFVSREISGHLIGKVVRADVCKKAFGAMSDRRLVFQEDLCALYRIIAESSSAEIVSDRLYNYRVGDGISYRPELSPDEYFGTFSKYDELQDLRVFCAERFPNGSAAARALDRLSVRMVVATLSQALERLERPEDGREGVRRLRAVCSDEVLAAACAEWYRLKGVRLAEAARRYGLDDLLGDVALRQLDYVWRGHNARLRELAGECEAARGEVAALKSEICTLRSEIADLRAACALKSEVADLRADCALKSEVADLRADCALRSEVADLRAVCAWLEERARHPLKALFGDVGK